MFPVVLDLSRLNVVLVGVCKAVQRRGTQLEQCGAAHLKKYVVCQDGTPCIKGFDGADLNLPSDEDLKWAHVVMIVDINDDLAFTLADKAKSFGKIVNVEDRKEHCDFYFSSMVKRGDLLLAINTNGKSPALSVRIRKLLERMFPPSWDERLNDIAKKRLEWKKQGSGFKEVSDKTNHYIDEQGWLDHVNND